MEFVTDKVLFADGNGNEQHGGRRSGPMVQGKEMTPAERQQLIEQALTLMFQGTQIPYEVMTIVRRIGVRYGVWAAIETARAVSLSFEQGKAFGDER